MSFFGSLSCFGLIIYDDSTRFFVNQVTIIVHTIINSILYDFQKPIILASCIMYYNLTEYAKYSQVHNKQCTKSLHIPLWGLW